MVTKDITVHPPEEVARRLGGISVTQLVAILKAHGYEYTQLMPGSKPWGRGRQIWGMTDDQIATLVLGQRRRHPTPHEAEDALTGRPPDSSNLKAMGWDGVDRVRKIKSRPPKGRAS
jgi:hypothetical protein